MFKTISEKNWDAQNNYFPYFNLTMYINNTEGFDSYYNFGIGKLGKKFTLQQLDYFLNVNCKDPKFLVSEATENPNPEYDEKLSPEEAVLRSKRNSNAVTSAQERSMNRVFGNVEQPTKIVIDTQCNTIKQFFELCKVISKN